LLAQGADIEAVDSKGKTALHFAARKQHDAAVKLLLSKDAVIDIADIKGNTPLLTAAAGGSLPVVKTSETVQALLGAGADKSLTNKNGKTALDIAAGNEEIVNLLQVP
jgi:hypothetical protein